MKSFKRLPAAVGLWLAFAWSVPAVLAHSGSVQPAAPTSRAATVAPTTAQTKGGTADTAADASRGASENAAADANSAVVAGVAPVAAGGPAPQATVAAVASAPINPSAATAPVAAADSPVATPTAAPSAAGMQTAALVIGQPERHDHADHDDTTLGQRLFRQAVDGARLDPFNWAVHVYKSRHRIEVYYANQLFKTYHAVFGRSRLGGGKEWEGDSRTPEGAYLIIAKKRSARFRWFLRLNYPNATDQARFAELRASHKIAVGSREGGLVGLHGTDSPILNVEDVNWTLGCISVDDSDISEMAALLPVGTLVVINP